jgi:integrase
MPIYRDKRSGRWMFDFDSRINGQRIRRRQLLPPGWTRAQADAFDQKEGSALSALAHGIAKPRHLIGDAVASYLKHRAPELKAGANAAREIECMRDWWDGRPLDQLAKVCAEYAADQAGALKPATIKNRISYLRAACRWAWKRHDMGEADPGARVVVPTVRNAREVIISRRQMLQLARACRHPGVRAVIRIAYYSGMRVGEILTAQRVPGAFVLGDTKNGQPHIAPMHPAIRTAAAVPMPRRSEIDYYWPLARAACGLGHVTLHDLRHSAASAMIQAGVSLADVGAVLNHKSAASTKRYAHWTLDRKAAAVGKIGRKVG